MRLAFSFIVLILSGGIADAGPLPPPVTDEMFAPVDPVEAALGQLLFYDPILSGNRNIACATCHHPSLGTADGVPLAIGEGGVGLGAERRADPAHLPDERIPRNAPALFNLGAYEFSTMFHDGRLQADPSQPGGIRTPMDADMVTGFASVLSAQTMFPVLSAAEMAGGYRENEIGRLVRQGLIAGEGGAWDLIARRVAAVPAYSQRFRAFYPHIDSADDIAFTDISNAIAAFMAFEWRSDSTPFDAVLRGQAKLSGAAKRGADLFYGRANCGTCHSGPFQTDHDFHAMAAPQIGPGKSAPFEQGHGDAGRYLVTGDPADMFAFRTPSLRNVMLTAPYGHAGGHADLAEFISYHADPVSGLRGFDGAGVRLPQLETDDFIVLRDIDQIMAIAAAVRTPPVALTEADITDIVAFLQTLTDPAAVNGRLGIPRTVPSGLPVPGH
ncbi:Di-heme Cytochrome c peroxidase [Sulfitobacter noctilucae]|uniref:cytochrome-c peroxidase n=1 Tax=Sulfitobacter noctilucae TaxID=1342302 RepID=UPI0004688D6D|nr:cytochrome c peroxidase [Sulfitobacter noctilucae]KIN65554.1 Di-heme Cytochrome c peroxidase [Sulfitobacter noctilucae]